MALAYKVAPLPAVWPGKATPSWSRRRAPFKATGAKVWALLEREIKMLRGKNVVVMVDVDDRQIRLDGQLYSNARPRTPAVIVAFDVPDGRLQFPCDTFLFWESNVDAIARALEALRMVDRYGVQQGKQYTGFKALPASTTPVMTTEQAAKRISFHASIGDMMSIIRDRSVARDAVRKAKAVVHPDAGGSNEAFTLVVDAERILKAHHGGSL